MNDRILKWFYFPANSENKLPSQGCSHPVLGNAVNTPTNQAHQTPAAVGVRPQPKPGPSHLIAVSSGHKLPQSSQNLETFPNLNLSPPEGPAIGTHQAPLQASPHPGHHTSQTQDQHVFGSPAGDHLPNIPPRYDQLLDISLQLSNLSRPSFNFVVRGENLELTDANPALGSGSSSTIPDSPVVGRLQIDSGSFGQTPTLQGPDSLGDNVWHSGLTRNQPTLSPLIKPNQDLQSLKVDLGMQALTQQNGVNMEFSLYGSSGGMQMAKTEEKPRYQPQSQYDPSQTSQLHPVLQSQAQYSPDQTSRDETYVPANIKNIASKNTVSNLPVDTQRSVSTEPVSSATSHIDQNLERLGSIERRNTETVHSRVQNIRVKPPSKFVSSGHQLNQKPFVRQANSQLFNPSQYATGPTADGNRWTPQQLQEHRGSNIRQELVPEKRRVSTLKQEQGVHSVRVKSDRTAAIRLSDVSPNHQIHQQKLDHPSPNQQKLVQSVAETGNGGGQESASTLRNVLQPAGRDEKHRANLISQRFLEEQP